VFYLNFIKASQTENKSIIYLNFDRSIKNLLEQLGPLADYKMMTILDCFTFGKGEGAEVFLKFYEENGLNNDCQVIRIDEPRNADHVTGAFYGLHKTMEGDVRFVFDSLTGMQELWGGEDQILRFYSHSCPRLYELNTVAYWVVEKEAHSQRLRAHINKIAQVAIDLSLKRGKTSLTLVKAENRNLETLNEPFNYWTKDLTVTFDSKKRLFGRIDLGIRLKDLRKKRGLSQTDLAKLVGVTPSTISQIESNQIYPSLPGLLKIAETLSVEITSFFHEPKGITKQVVFSASEGVDLQFTHLPKESIKGKLVTPVDFNLKAEPYLIEIPPEKNLSAHFFIHKGEEMGYLLSGKLQLQLERAAYTVQAGDVVSLTSEMPLCWKNPGPEPARLLWIKVK
jgi:transcriptional regulator with XRE-family HTH domain